jgi:NAD-dependent deacetylase
MLPHEAIEAAFEASQNARVFFSIGTSGLVQPAASLPVAALQDGAVLVEINTEETPLTQYASFVLKGLSGVVLPELVRAVWEA